VQSEEVDFVHFPIASHHRHFPQWSLAPDGSSHTRESMFQRAPNSASDLKKRGGYLNILRSTSRQRVYKCIASMAHEKTFFIISAILGLIVCARSAAHSSFYTPNELTVKVERLDPAANEIIPDGVTLKKLAGGYKWTEGPIWIHDGYLLFAEIPSNSIRKLRPGDPPTIFSKPSGYMGAAAFGGPEPGSNGMTLDSLGRLTVAGHAQRDVYRIEQSSHSLGLPGIT
jgi:hypothetical protein